VNAAATRRLFVYWKVAQASAGAASAAAAAMHAHLRTLHPGLEATLLRRAEEAGEMVTLMEVYARPEGVDSALQATIEAAAARDLGPYVEGVRHLEVFVEP
jgi:Domain of unknown function (DUF4936)